MFMRRTMVTVGCVLLVCLGQCAAATTRKKSEPAAKIYAIVVSRATHADAEWRKVVDALRKKHNGKVIRYDSDVRESALELSGPEA